MEDDSNVGSPSPPFEGVITEEPEKQLESQGGEFDGTGEVDEVNNLHKKSYKSFGSTRSFWGSFLYYVTLVRET